MIRQTNSDVIAFSDLYPPLCSFIDRCREDHARLVDRFWAACENPDDSTVRRTFRRSRRHAVYLSRRIPQWQELINQHIQSHGTSAELRVFLLAKTLDLALWRHSFLLYGATAAEQVGPEDLSTEAASATFIAETCIVLSSQVEHLYPMKATYRQLKFFFRWCRRVSTEMSAAAKSATAGQPEVTQRLIDYLYTRRRSSNLHLLFQGIEVLVLRQCLASRSSVLDINAILSESDPEPITDIDPVADSLNPSLARPGKTGDTSALRVLLARKTLINGQREIPGEPKPLKLIEYMLKQSDGTASVAAIELAVWGDESETDTRLATAIRRANHLLEAVSAGIAISRAGDHVNIG